jgi:uncharacterized protein YcfL
MRKHAIFALGILALALAACGGDKELPVVQTVESDIPLNTVEFLDEDIRPDQGLFGGDDPITISAASARRLSTGTMQVNIHFKNNTERPMAIQCRSTFFDEQKIPIEGPTAWQRVFLSAKSLGKYTENSTRTEAAYFHVEVRGGN